MLGSLTQTDMSRFQSDLLTHRAELSERLKAIERDIAKKLSADSSEQAIELENEEVLRELASEAADELNRITAALARMSAGQYGFCQQCEKGIGRERLLAYPSATHCIDCMLDHEQSGRNAGR